MKKIYAIVILLTLGITQTQIYAQCFNCDINSKAFSIGEGIASGTNSFAGGSQTTASENNSFVFGENSYVFQPGSIALGNFSTINSANSYVFGQYLNSSVNNSITIGLGTSSASLLSNSKPSSIMFGVTHKPSLTIVKPASGGDVGYLGIGTTNPQQKVHIDEGNLLITSTTSGSSNTPGGALLFAESTDPVCSSGLWGIEFLNSNDPIYGGKGLNFRTVCGKNSGSSLRTVLFLGNNGYAGIGTKDPQARLDVAGGFKAENANISGNISIFNASTNGLEQNAMVFGMPSGGFQQLPAPSKWGIERVKLGQEYGLNFWRYDFGNLYGGTAEFKSVMFFDNNDNLGIGTESPQAKLDVAGDFRAENAAIAGTFTTNNISITGNFGLGTNSPQEKLHVENGNLLIKRTVPKTSFAPKASLIFDVAQTGSRFTKWGIEYVDSRDEGYGLNFWKCDSATGQPTKSVTYSSILFLDDGGNVGIWKNNPTTTLDVGGSFMTASATVTGKSSFNGNVTVGTTSQLAQLNVNGALSAQSATLTGALSAASATLTGDLNAASATLTGALNAASATLTGDLNTASATLTGALNAANATLTGALNAASATLSGALNAASATIATINGNTYVTGNLGIGINPTTNKLEVKGTIRAEEVKVCLSQGCDFVFEEDYELMSLNDLNHFIKTNKHLPNVAPAAKMEAEGINLSEMNATLLQKVEELTLYVLDLQKQIDELKSKKP